MLDTHCQQVFEIYTASQINRTYSDPANTARKVMKSIVKHEKTTMSIAFTAITTLFVD